MSSHIVNCAPSGRVAGRFRCLSQTLVGQLSARQLAAATWSQPNQEHGQRFSLDDKACASQRTMTDHPAPRKHGALAWTLHMPQRSMIWSHRGRTRTTLNRRGDPRQGSICLPRAGHFVVGVDMATLALLNLCGTNNTTAFVIPCRASIESQTGGKRKEDPIREERHRGEWMRRAGRRTRVRSTVTHAQPSPDQTGPD